MAIDRSDKAILQRLREARERAKKRKGGLTQSQKETFEREAEKVGGNSSGTTSDNSTDSDSSGDTGGDTDSSTGDNIITEEVDGRMARVNTKTGKVVGYVGGAGGGAGEPSGEGNQAILDRINELAEMQSQRRISQIQEAKQKALGSLEQEKEGITPAYEEARRQTRASGRESARNFDEYLAQRGLSQSGAGAEAQIRQTQATGEQTGQLRQGETQALADIERRKSDVQTGTLADIERARMQQQESVMQGALQQSRIGQQQDFQQEMADTQFDQQLAINKLNNQQRKELEQISTDNQMKYLEKQDELARARQSGDISPVELYRRKMEIDEEFGVGDFADEYKDDYKIILAGIENRYDEDNYAGAYSAYVRNKGIADALLDGRIIQDLKQYKQNMDRAQRVNLGGRPIR